MPDGPPLQIWQYGAVDGPQPGSERAPLKAGLAPTAGACADVWSGNKADIAGRFRIAFPGSRRVAGLGVGVAPERTFIGGVRAPLWGFNLVGGWNATVPFARLSLFAEGLRLGSSLPFLPLKFLVPVPTWEARYEELSEVSAVGNISGFTTGVRFRATRASEWIVFWTLDRPNVLQALAARGVAVTTTPVRFRYFDPGR